MARWCTQLGPRLMDMSNYIISIQNGEKKLDSFFILCFFCLLISHALFVVI